MSFTREEILEELVRIMNPAPGGQKQPQDFTSSELAEHLGISTETVRQRMKALVRNGQWMVTKVYDEAGRVKTVYRKMR